MHQGVQTEIPVMQKQVNPVTLEFGGDPNKRGAPRVPGETGATSTEHACIDWVSDHCGSLLRDSHLTRL